MRRKITLTIGISAFNEEDSLPLLLEDVRQQDLQKINLQKVLIVSDGSSDQTVKSAKAVTGLPIQVIDVRHRKGKGKQLNRIFSDTSSDLLVILDADIRIFDPQAIHHLVLPIIQDEADLTSAKVSNLPPHNWMQRSLAASQHFKHLLFESHLAGNHILTCHGRARGFSKKLYTKLRFIDSIGEDAFSYLWSVKQGYPYRYCKDVSIFYTLPATLRDHFKQSNRFYQSTTTYFEVFGKEFTQDAYRLPRWLTVQSLISTLQKYPASFSTYLFFMTINSFLKPLRRPISRHGWSIAQTSKTTG